MALFDAPDNPRHPTAWLTGTPADDALMAANLGLHAEPLSLAPGKTLSGEVVFRNKPIDLVEIDRGEKTVYAVIFNTGWGQHWKDPATYGAGCPGPGAEVGEYLVERNVSMIGGDTWPVEAIPSEDEAYFAQLHLYLQTVHGVWFIENLNHETMNEMASDGAYEFLWIYVPVPFAGATGSPGEPIAVR